MWTKQQIEYHKKAARSLIKIKDLTFDLLRRDRSISEHETQQFIIGKYNEYGLETDKYPPIVAFNKNSAIPLYYPKKISEKLKDNTLVLIDLWARMGTEGAPFADITWVAFSGKKVPTEIKKVFDIVIDSRDSSLGYIVDRLKNNEIPTGNDIESVGFGIIKEGGYEKNILHELGHSIGTREDHGPKPNWIYKRNKRRLVKNLAYTIEPGIYLKDKFGIRSEIDFFISDNNEIVLTTDPQKEIVLL
ncbi:MAG: M24 family metallopeptidase [Candidatus Paceibacterota bacterium]|jgi:Xaa-Pro dipeptidase